MAFSTVSLTSRAWPDVFGFELVGLLGGTGDRVQPEPLAPQRSHCHAGVLAALVQVPSRTLSVWPCWIVPVIAGGGVRAALPGGIASRASEAATFQPPLLAAVSWTSIHMPTSSGARACSVCAAAPGIVAQLGRCPAPVWPCSAATCRVARDFAFPAAVVLGQGPALHGDAGDRGRRDAFRRQRERFFARAEDTSGLETAMLQPAALEALTVTRSEWRASAGWGV